MGPVAMVSVVATLATMEMDAIDAQQDIKGTPIVSSPARVPQLRAAVTAELRRELVTMANGVLGVRVPVKVLVDPDKSKAVGVMGNELV
jgi:hypothetical protein